MNCKSVTINNNKGTSAKGEKAREQTGKGETTGNTRRQVYDHYVDVMYTNQANLEHTIMVQQRLFQQSLADSTRSASLLPSPCAVTPTASASSNYTKQRHSRDQRSTQASINDSNNSFKWVVRRRKDGTRYVTRTRCQDDDPETRRPSVDDATSSKRRQKPAAETDALHRRATCDETSVLNASCAISPHEVTKIPKDVGQLVQQADKQISGNMTSVGSFETRAQQQRNHPILAVITI
jgi:hypothetical protein